MSLAAWTGYQALKARDALQAAAADVEVVGSALTTGETERARSAVRSAQRHARTARENTTGPGWSAGRLLPAVGDDVEAVQTIADVVDRLSRDVLPRAVDASETLSPEALRPRRGRIDLEPIEQVAPDVTAAADSLEAQRRCVEEIDADGLVAQLRGPVVQLQEELARAADLTDTASRAVQLLPPMLGSQGPRTYLALFQNNAEVRATGGMPGALATITARNGRLAMEQQGTNIDLGGRSERPALPLTPEERRLFDVKMGVYPQDSNFTPDFPRTAELVQAQWERAQGQRVDGVVSTDPVALSHVLEGTGPVRLPDGTRLTAGNAVRLLLNELYLTQPAAVQDQVYEAAARVVFEALARGKGQPRAVLDGLDQAVEERRLLVWSAHPEEQALLADTRIGGALSTEPGDAPQIGVYFNDATSTKMHYYFDYDVDVEPLTCEQGRQDFAVSVTMRSTAPPAGVSLPTSVTGPSDAGVEEHAFLTNVYVYGPVAGSIVSAALDGSEDYAYNDLSHEGRPVYRQTVGLRPGEERTLEFRVRSGPGQTGEPQLRVTPGVHGTGIGEVGAPACS